MISRCSSPIPAISVCPVSSSTFDLGSIATWITGSGKCMVSSATGYSVSHSVSPVVTLRRPIAAAVGLKSVSTGDTICDEKKPIVLESMDFPEPVIQLAIEPKTKADQEKLGAGLQKLRAEDPTFHVQTDLQTGQVIIAGMGELHLEIIVDRLKREFNVEAMVGKPQVAYKETLTRPADGEMKYAKQTGGRGAYGHAKIHLYPGEPGTGYVFENDIVGGTIPKEFIKPIDEGIKEALTRGVLAGYPVSYTHLTLPTILRV